ncbi:putative endonuclease or glycosyl hydrolase with C2H2-type zinc finger domain-containing protein [Hirschfeldia incana]|nr:putative endonuclease or glycosyl hydrolase with C2H2-type zinc finger domain-containing protein [Hirschfeldia incana]
MTTVEYSKVKTSVWWDIENCEVPRGWDAHAVAQNMGSALLKMNYTGPVSILAYGDTNLIPHHVQQALSSTGVGLNHVPAGVKDASDKKILVDMLLWAVDNPAPANIMLISGDRDFSNALHQLSMRRYTILLAHPTHASAPLVAAAKNVWLWTSLASGGPPLTSGESSGPVNNPVSEPAQSSKPTGSSSVAGDINVTSSDSFRAHLSDKRHTSQVAFVASHKAHASVSTKPVHESDVVEPVLCVVCQISCISKEAYANHIYGKRHRSNLELQSGKVENVSLEPVVFPKEVLTRHARRMRRRQMKKLIDSKKLQGKGVGEQSQPREESMAEPQVQSQNTQEKTKCLEKQSEELREILLGTSESSVKERLPRTKDHADTVNKQLLSGEARECFDGIVKPKEVLARQNRRIRIRPRKVLIDSKKLQEKSVGEKSQPREESIAEPQFQSQDTQEKHVASVNQSEALPVEKIAEPQLPSQNTQEKTKCLEKQSEELRKILIGTSEISVKEKLPRTKDRETVNKQLLYEEARECFDGIVKPVNESQGATDPSMEMKRKQKEVMERRAVGVISKLCHLCVVICDSQGVSTVVCDRLHHWPNQKAFFAASDHVVWCRVCQISCKKAAYENHTNGEKHRQKLELQSAKNENMSKGQAKLSEENAVRMKKVLCNDQTAFDSLKHADMVKEQTDAFVKSRKSRDESYQGAQEDKEDVKEVNAVSENLVHAFNGLNRESRIPKESRGCLDVIPERVQVPPDVHVTGKFEAESKNKTEKEEGAGGKEHPGEAGKREESKKVQVDNLWTRLWWGKS